MPNLRIYIAGPMSGLPEFNFPAFEAAAVKLRNFGFEVVSPVELNPDKTSSWGDCMRRDIAALVTCNAIYLLKGWDKSKGATLEHHIAERLELKIFHEREIAFEMAYMSVKTIIAPCKFKKPIEEVQ